MSYLKCIGCRHGLLCGLIVLLAGLSGCDAGAPIQAEFERPVAASERPEPWAGNLRIKEPAPGQHKAVAYLTIHNPTEADLAITDVRTAAAGSAQVHRHFYEDGMMKMRPVAHTRIPARGELAFEPGSYHIMLMDLVKPLVAGEQVTLTIEFADGRLLDVNAPVLK